VKSTLKQRKDMYGINLLELHDKIFITVMK